MADCIMEVSTPSVAAVHTPQAPPPSEIDSLRSEVRQLKDLVLSLSHQSRSRDPRHRSPTPTRRRSPSPSHHTPDPTLCWYHQQFGEAATKYRPKRPGQALATTGVPGLVPSRLFYVCDHICGLRFFVDTGAEVSILPPSHAECKCPHAKLTMQAINGSPIATYGTRSLTLDRGLRRIFRWVFVIADVERPILGADILRHFHLLVDMKRTRLIDSTTQLRIQGIRSHVISPRPSILLRSPTNEFEALLSDYPLLLNLQTNPQNILSRIISTHLAPLSPLAPAAYRPNVYASLVRSLNISCISA